MRAYLTFSLLVPLAFLLTGSPLQAQSDGSVQTQLDALEQRINAAQSAWQKAYDSVDQFSMADMPRWNALVDARSRELDRLREQRARLAQATSDDYARRASDLNTQIAQLKNSTVVGSANMDFLNNVAKNPTRADFERSRQQMSQEWQSKYGDAMKSMPTEQDKINDGFKRYFPDGKTDGYQRIGVHNPYTGDYWVRFYDDKDKGGRAKFEVWSDGYEGWKRWQDDVATYWRRRASERDELLKQAQDTQKKLDGMADA
jgi:hypothetical protein